MVYAVAQDVAVRIPGRTIDSDSTPNTTTVNAWLADAQAMLDSALRGAGLPAPYSEPTAVKILKTWCCDYAEGRVRQTNASAGGDATNDDGQPLIDRFMRRVEPGGDIMTHPDQYAAYLGAGAGADAQSRPAPRSYWTDNSDGKSIANGDFVPTFTTKEVF